MTKEVFGFDKSIGDRTYWVKMIVGDNGDITVVDHGSYKGDTMSVELKKENEGFVMATDLRDGQLAVIIDQERVTGDREPSELHGMLVQKNGLDLVAVANVTPASLIGYYDDTIHDLLEVRIVPNKTMLIVRDNV